MTEDIDSKHPSVRSAHGARIWARTMIAYFGLIFAIEFLSRDNLADKIPIVLTLAGAGAGLFYGLLTVAEFYKSDPNDRSFKGRFVLFVIPIFCLFGATFLTRAVFLELLFVGVDTVPVEAKATVVSRQTRGRRRLSDNLWVNVAVGHDGREFRVLVSKALYDTIGSSPADKRHCIKLSVHTGRWGYRKVIAPNHFDKPLGMDSYSAC